MKANRSDEISGATQAELAAQREWTVWGLGLQRLVNHYRSLVEHERPGQFTQLPRADPFPVELREGLGSAQLFGERAHHASRQKFGLVHAPHEASCQGLAERFRRRQREGELEAAFQVTSHQLVRTREAG